MKTITIIAALELGRQRREEYEHDIPFLNNSKRVYAYIRDIIQDIPHEEFWVIYHITGCKVVDTQLIGRGGNDFTLADESIILRYALQCKANSIILIHNHPTGILQPSQADKILSNNIVDATKIMDIRVNDHIIFTDTSYYSFTDEGLL